MQLTPELEAELRLALDTYWNSYLEGDLETWASYLADEYHNIGTTEEEVWQSKQEIVDYTRSVIQQLQGGAQVRNKTFQFYPIDPYIMVHELGDMYLIHQGDWVFYARSRMTTLMVQKKEGWKILHQHGSYPDANASQGDVLGFEKIKTENSELREAVQRRTIDLEIKNRELEIEAALQRVRAVAMGMKIPNEMLDVCKVISAELEKFGVRHIRNIQTVIISKEISDYTCYQYFTAYRLTAIEQTHFERNKVEQALVDRMLDAKGGYFEGILSGEEMDVFRLYRKREKFFEDPLLDQCEEAFYYFYSIGEGGLGITLYEDMDAEGLSLFKRFHQVFSLAYQRFRDIENAEAQAREAQIEAAMEKVRSRSLAMQGPDEIRKVAELLRNEMAQLGIEALETSSIYIREPGKDTIECWYAIKDVRGEGSSMVSDEMHLDLKDTWVGREMLKFLLFDDEQTSIKMQGEHRKEWINYCAQRSEALQGYYGTEIPERTYHLVKFAHGFMGAASPGEISAESWRLLKRAAAVFSFSYTRFLDLRKSAQNAREAQIELGLERVRAKTMAMYKSTQLSETARVLFEQFSELGRIPDRMSIGIVKDEIGLIEWWATDQTGSQLTNHFDASIEQPTVAKIFAGWKEGKESMVIEITGEELKAWVAFVKDKVQMPMDDTKIKGKRVHHAAYFSQGILLISAHEKVQDETMRILVRFAKVFEQAYTRFLDLKKAEAQAREAQIEVALERVRAKAMAMHSSEDLSEVVGELRKQMGMLGQKDLETCVIHLHDESPDFIYSYAAIRPPGSSDEILETTTMVPKKGFLIIEEALEAYHQNLQDYIIVNEGEKLKQWFAFLEKESPDGFRKLVEPVQGNVQELRAYWSLSDFSGGALVMVTMDSPDEHTRVLLRRFSNVFGLAYRRYADLKKAEAQAREALIEAALERVRSKTMAMHNSADVGETAAVMVEELRKLGIDTLRCGIGIMHEPGDMEVWTIQTEQEGKSGIIIGTLDMHLHPLLQGAFENWRKKGLRFSYILEGEDLIRYYAAINSHPNYPIRYDLSTLPSLIHHNEFHFPEGVLFAFSLEPLHETQKAIFQRFAGIFGQTYRRYLDLTRAEAQAREAQIEAALEKIRSRSLAMHSSQELIDVIAVVFEKMNELKILMGTVAIWLFDMESFSSTFWLGNEVQKEPSKVSLPYDEGMMNKEGLLRDAWEARRTGKNIINRLYEKRLKDEYFDYVFKNNDYQTIPEDARQFIRDSSSLTMNLIIEKNSALFVDTWTDKFYNDEQLDVFKRVARVFEQAYVRFLDLQKAEAQARESNIEAALERVRSKAMAMRTSEDIAETTAASFEELRKLGVFSFRSGVGILSKDSRTVQVFADSRAEDDRTVALTTVRSMDEHPALQRQYDSWLEQKDFEQVLRGDELSSYYSHSFFKGSSVEQRGVGEQQEEYGYYFAFPDGLFYSWSLQPYSEQEKNILHRFRNIISLTFRRYLDLQKAEIQALEATKQASLDRVRGVISSMRSAEDLNLITPLIFKELTILGVPFIRCGVFIIHEGQQIIEAYLSAPDGHSLGVLNLPFNASDLTYKTVAAWRKNDMLLQHWNKEDFVAWTNQMVSEHQIEDSKTYQGADLPPDSLDLHFVPFAQGMLYVGTTEPLEESKLELVQSLARTFSIAYARYEDFVKLENAKEEIESALTELKATQKQLIQSEKMASLGELTAGIAHEIQNPLNFVNNFSEVSKELIEEVKESIAKGEMADAMDMMSDLVQNLEKINEHGKRADSIVKGMLQHSRAGSGQKEPTDINVLADECLRLAFHGLRAKDKSFNANFETVFDTEIGKIDVMPQDMGRVLLNLINNAFYTVNEKSKRGEVGYKPMVKVSTEKREKGVGIRVWDNGDGIPDAIKEKIFQPFFTTKPTGQGTGLGLSLAYDIVKAHGGELTVESRVGEGTGFFILLPSS